MRTIFSRAALSLVLAGAAQVAAHGIALGHTSGSDATPEHVLIEVVAWGLAVAAVLGLVVVVFWVRAKWRPE